MQEKLAFPGFTFQIFSRGECPLTHIVMHPLWKTSTPSINKSVTMSIITITTENAKYAWCAVKRTISPFDLYS
jgi:hypothetical protein